MPEIASNRLLNRVRMPAMLCAIALSCAQAWGQSTTTNNTNTSLAGPSAPHTGSTTLNNTSTITPGMLTSPIPNGSSNGYKGFYTDQQRRATLNSASTGSMNSTSSGTPSLTGTKSSTTSSNGMQSGGSVGGNNYSMPTNVRPTGGKSDSGMRR